MFVETPTDFGVMQELYRHRNELSRAFKGLQDWWKRGKLKIVVFGPGGSGKTTFGKFMSEKFAQESVSTQYIESRTIETYNKLKGISLAEVIVPPGQAWRRDIYWRELYDILREGRSVGVVNIVSWGYQYFEDFNYSQNPYYTEFDRKIDELVLKEKFLNEITKRGREEEIKIMKELAPRLADIENDIWMITLVTKQDLWWKEKIEVRRHYTEGEYNTYIQNILDRRGAHHFKHEYLSASLVVSNFMAPSGEIITPSSEGYDQNIRNTHLRVLLKTIETYASE